MATKNATNAPREVETVPGSVPETLRSNVRPFRGQLNTRDRVTMTTDLPSRTKQQFAQECDINNIMARYQKTGAIAHANQNEARYGFATGLDFRESIELVKEAQDQFNDLPSSLRKKFGNSPQNYLEFVQDPANQDEMIRLGMATDTRPPAETPPEASEKPLEPPKTND